MLLLRLEVQKGGHLCDEGGRGGGVMSEGGKRRRVSGGKVAPERSVPERSVPERSVPEHRVCTVPSHGFEFELSDPFLT